VAPFEPLVGGSPSASTRPDRGPDRRGVARFAIPAGLPTQLLVAAAAVWLAFGDAIKPTPSPDTLVELEAIAATLALMGGIACLLRWRLDGIARGWWCGWALLVIGAGQIALEPIRSPDLAGVGLAAFVLAIVLFTQAILGPEVDTSIGWVSTLTVGGAGLVLACVPAIVVGGSASRARTAHLVVGCAWLLVAAMATVRRRRRRDPESGWVIPVAVSLGLADLVPLALENRGAQLLASRWFELTGLALACVGALGGLVSAAVHHRTRALRERIEHERELANRHRVEESFADRLHELRSTVVAIEGGVSTLPDGHDESTLRAALIAEIRRLRTLVNESPAAAGVEAFDVGATLQPTIQLARASGQEVDFDATGARPALGRPDEIAQVVHGLLTNASKYAPGAAVHVTIRHLLDEIAIRVEDDGAGIDPEYWDLVFERGFRIHPEGGADGAGLGLALARRIVRSQDGDLWVEEGQRGGAAFVISIPAAPALRVVPPSAETYGEENPNVTPTSAQEAR